MSAFTWTKMFSAFFLSSFIFLVFAPLAHAVELGFSNNVISISKGEQRTINIALNGDNQGGIVGVDMVIHYDPSKVKVVSASNLGVFSRQMALKIDNSAGKISYSLADFVGQQNPTIAPMGNVEIASITIEGLEVGTSTFDFDYSPGDTTDSNVAQLGGNDVLTSTKNIRVNVNNSGNTSSNPGDSNSKTISASTNDSDSSSKIVGETNTKKADERDANDAGETGEVAGESAFNPEKAKEYVQNLLGVSDAEKNSLFGINWKSPRVVAGAIILIIALAVAIGFLVGFVYKKQNDN